MKKRMNLMLLLSLVLGLLLTPAASRSQGSSSPSLAAGQTATLLPDGRWLLLGGEGPSGPLRTATIWDPRTHVSTRLFAELQHPRAWQTATLLPDGTILIVGGIGADGRVVDAVELFDPDTHTFETVPPSGLTPRALTTPQPSSRMAAF